MGKGDNPRPVDIGKWEQNYTAIFGNKKPTGTVSFVNSKAVKYKHDVYDNPNHREIVKVGHEINRYKALDGPNKQGIEKRFKADADKFWKRKVDPKLTKEITMEIVRGLRRE